MLYKKFTNILNFKQTVKEMNDLKYKNNTKKTYAWEIVKVLQTLELTTRIKRVIDLYRNLGHTLQEEYLMNTTKPTKKEKENQLNLDQLRKIWLEKYQDTYEFFVVGLYIWMPARRSDYVNLELKKDENRNFIFYLPKQVKVNKTEEVFIQIPDELEKMDYPNYVNLLHKNTNNSFVKQIARYSKKIFDKDLTINLYRKIWVDYIKKNGNDLDDRIELAENMNHSLMTSKKVYEKNFS